MLEVRHLRIVDALMQTGTVTQAAERLFVTQPAVSHALGALHAKLGVTLFRREGRRMVPTEEGRRLHQSARHILAELARVEEEIGQYRTGQRGTVHLATGCYMCYHWLPGVLKQFTDAFPQVDLQIVPEVTQTPIRALKEERLDLAVVQLITDDTDLELEVLFEDELLVVMSPDHPLAGQSSWSPEDFAGQTLIVHDDYKDSAYYEPVFGSTGIEPDRVLALQLTQAVLESTKAGIGVTIMPEWVVAPELKSGRLVSAHLTENGVFRAWQLATRAEEASPPVIELKRMLHQKARDAALTCRG